jgi:hypothetical protein
MGDDFGKILSLFFLGCIFVLVVTHSSGFATSAGSLFTTTDDLVEIFTGTKVNTSVPEARVTTSGSNGRGNGFDIIGTSDSLANMSANAATVPGNVISETIDGGKTVIHWIRNLF